MTHKYKVEWSRIFRGRPILLGKPEYIEVGANSADCTIIRKSKEAFGLGGIKTNKQDLGDIILLKPRGCKTHQLSIQFCN
jgi:hypothetical protein